MKTTLKCLLLLLAAVLPIAGGCGREAGIIGAPSEPIDSRKPNVSMTFKDDELTSTSFTDGNEILVGGTLNKKWSIADPENLDHAGSVINGLPVISYSRKVEGGGEGFTACYFERDPAGYQKRFLGMKANGVPLTAIVGDRWHIYNAFFVNRDDTGQNLVIDPIRDDTANLVPVTIGYTGFAFGDPNLEYLNKIADPNMPVAFKTTWNSVGSAVPAIWRNGAWEQDIYVLKGVTQMVRCEYMSNGQELRPGLYVGGTELKNLYDIDSRPPSPGSPNSYFYFEFTVDANGTVQNLRPTDERWLDLTGSKPEGGFNR
jgi:hypothetical protein